MVFEETSEAWALHSPLATLADLLTPAAPVPHKLFRTPELLPFAKPQTDHPCAIFNPKSYCGGQFQTFCERIQHSEGPSTRCRWAMGGVGSVSRWGLWGAYENLERDCVGSKIEPVTVRVVLWWCGAGGNCSKCRKTLLFSTSLSSSVLILFFHSSSFLAHGLSCWPLLIIQPPPPPPAGRLRGLLVAWFRRIILVSAIAWKKDLSSIGWGVWRWCCLHRVWCCLHSVESEVE